MSIRNANIYNPKPESKRVLIQKYKGLHKRVLKNEVTDFEFSLFKAMERKLNDIGFFQDYRESKLYRPLFIEADHG